MARYGHVSPDDAARWELLDLQDFAKSLSEIVKEENKVPPSGRRR